MERREQRRGETRTGAAQEAPSRPGSQVAAGPSLPGNLNLVSSSNDLIQLISSNVSEPTGLECRPKSQDGDVTLTLTNFAANNATKVDPSRARNVPPQTLSSPDDKIGVLVACPVEGCGFSGGPFLPQKQVCRLRARSQRSASSRARAVSNGNERAVRRRSAPSVVGLRS